MKRFIKHCISTSLTASAQIGSRFQCLGVMPGAKVMLVQFFSLGLFFCFIIGNAYATSLANYKISQPDPEDVMPFAIALSHIKQFYVKDAKDEKLFAGAIRGMLKELDPHSAYLDEQALKQLKMNTRGNFVGVGIVVGVDHNTLRVVSPIKGSPAAKAGIKSGDFIIAINHKPTFDMDINEAVKLIRGKPGTKVTLTIANLKEKRPRDVILTRKKLDIQNVSGKRLEDDFAYIQIIRFQKGTAKAVKNTFNQLNQQKPLKGLILDLRNNPGGLLDEGILVSDLFLNKKSLPKDKTIVYTQERGGKVGMRMKAKTADLTRNIPIVILINQGSASASEIVAGALQDYHRAVVLGTQSFGKGSVQTLLPLDNKSAIKLTTALYYTPKGRSIQTTGIKPDVVVEELQFKEKDKKDEVLAFLTNLREKDLNGHLQNGNGKTIKNTQKASQSVPQDNQLYEAKNILKAISLVESKENNENA